MLLLSNRVNQQPQQALALTGDGICRGIVGVILPNVQRELLTSTYPTFSGTPVYGAGPGGFGRIFPTENTNYEQYAGAWSRPSGQVSHLTLYSLTNTVTVTARLSGNFTTTTNGYGFLPSTTNLRYATARSGANSILTGAAHVVGKLVCALGVTDATNNTLYENGLITAGPTAHGGWTASTGNFRFGLDSGGAAAAVRANIFLSIVWNRALTDAEARSITQNPWQIFKQQSRRIFVEAGGNAYSLDAQSGSMDIDGQTAQTIATRLLNAESGAISLTGQTAQLKASRFINAELVSLNINGEDATLKVNRFVNAENGNILLDGNNAELVYSGSEPSGGQKAVIRIKPIRNNYVCIR